VYSLAFLLQIDESNLDVKLIEIDECQASERTVFIMPPEPTGLPEGVTYQSVFPLFLFLHAFTTANFFPVWSVAAVCLHRLKKKITKYDRLSQTFAKQKDLIAHFNFTNYREQCSR
jgi:hypothetical protein